MQKAGSQLPLIDHCEGADADDRASIASAWLRIWRQQSKPGVTDLHCEQFVLAVFACDKRRTGVQWSYGEIADRLRVSVPTARKIVERCVGEFGLIAVVEERYARGGQAANKYMIDFQMVRAINANMATRGDIARGRRSRPADTPGHPGATTDHPGDTRYQPYKECPSVQASISPPPVPQVAILTPEATTPGQATWEEVEEVFFGLPAERRPSQWRLALQHARQSAVTPGHVLSILQHYQTQGTAFSAGALYHRLRHCHPQVAPEAGWPKPTVSSAVTKPSAGDETKRLVSRVEFIACKDRGKVSDDEIRSRIAAELRRIGLDPSLSDWCKVVEEVA